MLKVVNCPHCNQRIMFNVQSTDVDHSGRYPAPLYLKHVNESCNKWVTVYFDSQMKVSLAFKDKEEKARMWKFVKEIESKK